MGAACLALAGLAIYQVNWIAPELRSIQEQIGRSFEMIKSARVLERTLADAERSERNHRITEDPAQDAEYRALAHTAPALLSNLARLADDHSQQRNRMTTLEQQVRVALGDLTRLAEIYERDGPVAARRALRDNLGTDAMRPIAQTLDAVVTAEDDRLSELQARAAQHERTFAGAALGTGLLAVMVMALGAFQLVHAFRNVRQLAEEQRVSEAQFRLFVRGVTDYGVYTLDPEGRITSWNAGGVRRGPKDGSARPADRRRRARLQQPAPGDPGLSGGPRAAAASRASRRRQVHRDRAPRRRPRRGPGAVPARLRAPPAARAPGRQPEPAGDHGRGLGAAQPGREDR